MSMYVEYKDPNTGRTNIQQYHKGAVLPTDRYGAIVSLQADGHELEYVQGQFTNIPQAPSNRVVTWYGDHAKFIYANIRWEG